MGVGHTTGDVRSLDGDRSVAHHDALGALRRELHLGAGAVPAAEVLLHLRAVVERLDPAQVSGREALELVRVLDRVERVAATAKAAAAGRVAETELWRRAGHRSPAHWLARETGVGVAEAGRLLDTVTATAPAPVVDDALRAGAVSPRQGRALGAATAADPEAGEHLLERAGRLSVRELEDEAARIVSAASPEPDADRAARHRRSRAVHAWTDAEGMGCGRWRLPPAEHARLMAEIAPGQDAAFRAARRAGEHEPPAAYAADGLVALLGRTVGAPAVPDPHDAGPESCPTGSEDRDEPSRRTRSSGRAGPGRTGPWANAKVIVRVDLPALDRGGVVAGEVSEIAGVGPVPVESVWQMIDGGALVALLATRGSDIERVVHLGRHPTALQRTALEWSTAGTCAIEGCASTARLEIDHVADWRATHETRLPDLAAVCGFHHDLKTHHGHRFGPRTATGARRLIPPDGPGGIDLVGSGPIDDGTGPGPPRSVDADPPPGVGATRTETGDPLPLFETG